MSDGFPYADETQPTNFAYKRPMTPNEAQSDASRERVDLLPCPFCAGDHIRLAEARAAGLVWWKAECDQCGAQLQAPDEPTAIADWNRRASRTSDHAAAVAAGRAEERVPYAPSPEVPLHEALTVGGLMRRLNRMNPNLPWGPAVDALTPRVAEDSVEQSAKFWINSTYGPFCHDRAYSAADMVRAFAAPTNPHNLNNRRVYAP